MVGLAGCNLPRAPVERMPSTPTEAVQINRQAAKATSTATPITLAPVSTIQTNEGTATPAAIISVPVSSIKIEGVAYQAYQIPGRPVPVRCQEPCPLDLQYIFAEYAGFRLAHPMLIKLTELIPD